MRNFDDIINSPCAGHKINSSVDDLFKIRNVKVKADVYSVKEFNDEGKLQKTVIDLATYDSIQETNRVKTELNQLIQKCRHLVGSFHHNDLLQIKLKEEQIKQSQECKIKLIQDVKTRWNYTHDLLVSILINEKPLRVIFCILNF